MSGNKHEYVFDSKAVFHSPKWWKDRDQYVRRICSLQSSDPDKYWHLLSEVDGVDYSEKRRHYLASAEPMIKHYSFGYTPVRIEDPSKNHTLKDVKIATYQRPW